MVYGVSCMILFGCVISHFSFLVCDLIKKTFVATRHSQRYRIRGRIFWVNDELIFTYIV